MSSEIKTILDKFWEWRLSCNPEFATMIGCHQYDNRLDSHALDAYQTRQVKMGYVRHIITQNTEALFFSCSRFERLCIRPTIGQFYSL